MKTTNYYNTFIEVAEDCARDRGEIPPLRAGKKTIARMQYEMISEHPYRFTSDDIIFRIQAERKGLPLTKAGREKFFSKGRACLRSSPLGKRYGWGLHHNEEGKVALYGMESDRYHQLAEDEELTHTRAMRSSRSK